MTLSDPIVAGMRIIGSCFRAGLIGCTQVEREDQSGAKDGFEIAENTLLLRA